MTRKTFSQNKLFPEKNSNQDKLINLEHVAYMRFLKNTRISENLIIYFRAVKYM